MAEIPEGLQYTAEHEYLKPTADPSVMIIGITDFAQGELGDIVYVDLPKVGATFGSHAVFGTIEAVKAVSELFCPLEGEVVEVNARLDGEPALVNTDPYGDGWMIKLRVKGATGGLMSAAEYAKHIGQ
ncbi:MAG: glycine cleavage system protein GcvH [Gemmatimonadaceae bacterium]|nr:glycine cleavage system protein GcvH [Gemmatimonadaceae bacterium]